PFGDVAGLPGGADAGGAVHREERGADRGGDRDRGDGAGRAAGGGAGGRRLRPGRGRGGRAPGFGPLSGGGAALRSADAQPRTGPGRRDAAPGSQGHPLPNSSQPIKETNSISKSIDVILLHT